MEANDTRPIDGSSVRRREPGGNTSGKGSAAAGLGLFVALTFLGTWTVASTLRVLGLTVAPAPLGTRLLTTTLLYALMMGWQPIVAALVVRRWVDPPDRLDFGLRPASVGFSVAAGLGALLLAAAASLCGAAATRLGWLPAASFHGAAELGLRATTAVDAGALVVALFATLALVCVQAVAEEFGWRGYLLPRAMERFGRWPGLVAHGVVWGLWYAPVVFFTAYGPATGAEALGRGLGFVVTCALLGTLLGWLRLASGSLAPVVLANTTLTLAAGLPYVLHNVDAGVRSAAYHPVGWAALALAIGALLLTRWRHAVRVPPNAPELAARSVTRVWVWVERGTRRRDLLN